MNDTQIIPPVRQHTRPRRRLFPGGWKDAAYAALTLLLLAIALVVTVVGVEATLIIRRSG